MVESSLSPKGNNLLHQVFFCLKPFACLWLLLAFGGNPCSWEHVFLLCACVKSACSVKCSLLRGARCNLSDNENILKPQFCFFVKLSLIWLRRASQWIWVLSWCSWCVTVPTFLYKPQHTLLDHWNLNRRSWQCWLVQIMAIRFRPFNSITDMHNRAPVALIDDLCHEGSRVAKWSKHSLVMPKAQVRFSTEAHFWYPSLLWCRNI